MIEEVLSFAFEEGCLLFLAALAYLFFTGSLGKGAPKQTTKVSKTQICAQQATVPSGTLPSGTLQAVTRSLRDGCATKMTEAILKHKAETSSSLPPGLGSRVLLLLARASVSQISVELVGQLSDQSLEKALIEASRRGEFAMCRKLKDICEKLQIQKTVTSYEVFAKTCSDSSEQLRSVVGEIDVAGLVYTKSLVEAILVGCAIAKDADLAAATVAKVNLPCSDKDLCSALINVYGRCGLWDMAICLYEEVMVPAQLKPDSAVADLLIQGANETGRTELVAALSELSVSDLVKHARSIRAFGKDGDLQSALALFHSNKHGANSLLYNSVLEACVQCQDLRMALQLLQEAKTEGFADTVSYNTVMKGQLAVGDNRAAHQMLEEMTQRGLSASLVTYHKLLNSKVQTGDVRAAWRLVEEMQKARLAPNAVTYSILLKAFVGPPHANDLAKAMKLIDIMETAMDEVLFASVAEACIRTGRLDVLSQRTRQYKENGALQGLTAPTYGSMIKAYGQAHDVDQVWLLWDEMAKRQVRPTSITLGCMVEALVMNHCCEQAWDLVQKISADECQKSLLNTVIYSTILKGFAMSKRLDRLMALYEEMRSSGIVCNTITYNTMLNAFAQCGDMQRVPQLLEDMKKAIPPVEPDIVTYSTMVKGFCAAGDVDKGLRLLHDMQNSNLAPDEVMFNSLLDGCARQHRLDDALELLETMKAAGVAPSNYTLSIMVKLLGRARRLNQAFGMVKSVCAEHGFRANVQVYTCLIQACFHNRQLAKAVALHDQIVQEGCVLDQKAYVALTRGCLQAGAVDRAADVVRCAHHIPGHGMQQPEGRAPGVDAQCLEEVVIKLGRNSEASKRLAAEVAAKGGTTQQSRYPPVKRYGDAKRMQQGKARPGGSSFIRDSLAVMSAC